MRHLLVESKVGGQYCQIVSRIKGDKFIYDENCLILDVTKSKISEFVVVFPFSYDFLIKSERKQHGAFGYMNLISIFFKNKFKRIKLKTLKVSLASSKYKLKNQKIVYIGLNVQGFFRECERDKVFEELFKYFSLNFKKNIEELKIHILDSNPYRYKYIN